MSSAKSSVRNPVPIRSRGLDALFEGPAAAHSSRDVDADLSALLDFEVKAAETGAEKPTADRAVLSPSAARPSGADGPAQETIDVPPTAEDARPVQPAEPVQPSPRGGTTPLPERVLPTTKRFGAIIMETQPVSASAGDSTGAESVLPKDPELAGGVLAPPGPGTEEPRTPLPATLERLDGEKTAIVARLSRVLDKDWQRAIHQQINELYRQVTTEYSSPPEKAERALAMLREARQLLVESPDEYVNAEYRLMQVQAMLERIKGSRKQSQFYAPRILAYEGAWLVLLLLGLVFADPVATLIAQVGRVNGPALLNVYPVINTMLWGGMGGVVGAFYTLWWHVSREQNFDRHYLMWYLVQPLMGLVLGGIIFLVMAGGFLILQVNVTDANASQGARLLPYLAAVLAGFRQNFIYEQFDRLITMFTPASRAANGGEGPAT